jgi:predicted  nucleic acid-binding Zn-ribbon protein
MSFHKWMVGVFLSVVMVAALGINALLFSARDFQYGLALIAPETNGLISVPRLLEVDEQLQRIEAETAGPRGELLQVQSELAAVDGAIATTQAELNETRAEVAGGIAQVESNASLAQVESAAAALEASELNTRVMALAGRPGLSPSDQQNVASLRGQVTQLAELESGLEARDTQRRELVARERLVGGQVAEADRRVFALQQSVVPNYEQYGRVRGEVFALRNMSPLGAGAFIAQGHPAFVSTVLVLLMGALGAILYLFPAYLTRVEPVTFAEIIVRLIFGMCVALAFYVVANATIAGFSLTPDARQAGTSASLNPFTVSLIGIVAGVLAEDIAKWIQERGKGVFTQASGTPRPAAADPATEGGLVNNQAIS